MKFDSPEFVAHRKEIEEAWNFADSHDSVSVWMSLRLWLHLHPLRWSPGLYADFDSIIEQAKYRALYVISHTYYPLAGKTQESFDLTFSRGSRYHLYKPIHH